MIHIFKEKQNLERFYGKELENISEKISEFISDNTVFYCKKGFLWFSGYKIIIDIKSWLIKNYCKWIKKKFKRFRIISLRI